MKTFTKLLFTATFCASPAFMSNEVQADFMKDTGKAFDKAGKETHKGLATMSAWMYKHTPKKLSAKPPKERKAKKPKPKEKFLGIF